MKIAQVINGASADLEHRKRAIQRREMGYAYKKNAQYQTPKNPMLEVLENLLSGKTEKELHADDQVKRESESEAKAFTKEQKSEQLEAEKLERVQVIVHEQAHKTIGGNIAGPITIEEVSRLEEQLKTLEKGKASATFYPQDLHTTEQVFNEEAEPFIDITTNVEIPTRFMHNFNERDVSQETLLTGREFKSSLYEHTFKKASMEYSNHIAMVKNGYRSFDEPLFSETA